jgi:glucose-6-phosphate isomerase
MNEPSRSPEQLEAWTALGDHYDQMRRVHMRDLFRNNPNRFDDLSTEIDGLFFDYSRNIATGETIELLADLSRQAGVETLRDRMFSGEHINNTEDRAVLHVALRSARKDSFQDGSQDCTADVHQMLGKVEDFVNSISGDKARSITDVVNIGIGGSDLGVVMAVEALKPYRIPGVRLHAVSNVDGTQLSDLIEIADPSRTLFIICSKSFATQETIVNANVARQWIVESLGEEAVADHFAAVSTNDEAMDQFGIRRDYRFRFWDWVGGRFSLWSAAGLAIALAIGMKNFRRMLEGGHAIDEHFLSAPLERNMPVILAGLSIWYNNFFGATSQAVLPYDNRLSRFPAFLQQLHMESNGKRVRRDGSPVAVESGTVIFGEAGSNAQHSFYQLLHQGTRLIPVDFIATVNGSGSSRAQHDLALANCLAQAKALMDGRTADEVKADLKSRGLIDEVIGPLLPHKVHPGNRPSNSLVIPRLNPQALGKLIALYEHKVFVEGVIWGINSFDQWGVELGKKLASDLEEAVQDSKKNISSDLSTNGLLNQIACWRDSS